MPVWQAGWLHAINGARACDIACALIPTQRLASSVGPLGDARRLSSTHPAALRRASDAFAQPGLPVETAIQRVAQTIAELLGDACVVRVLDAEGSELVPVALVHGDPAQLARFQKVLVAGPVSAREGAHARVLLGSRPVIIEVADLAFHRTQPEQARILEEIGVARFIVAPMRTSRGAIGTVGFSREDPAWTFSAEDADVLQEIADRAALSIENARLLDGERKARSKAELASWALREKVAELEASESRFRAAFDAATFGMLVLSTGWVILQANRPFREHMGYSGDELLGSPFMALVHAADEQALREMAWRIGGDEERFEATLRLVKRGGEPTHVTLMAGLARDAADRPDVIVAHVTPHDAITAAPEAALHAGGEELTAIGAVLRNPVNVALLSRLTAAPTHARALARKLGRSEGDVQRKLRALEKAGLIAGAWRHREGATVKEYQVTGRTLQMSLGPSDE